METSMDGPSVCNTPPVNLLTDQLGQDDYLDTLIAAVTRGKEQLENPEEEEQEMEQEMEQESETKEDVDNNDKCGEEDKSKKQQQKEEEKDKQQQHKDEDERDEERNMEQETEVDVAMPSFKEESEEEVTDEQVKQEEEEEEDMATEKSSSSKWKNKRKYKRRKEKDEEESNSEEEEEEEEECADSKRIKTEDEKISSDVGKGTGTTNTAKSSTKRTSKKKIKKETGFVCGDDTSSDNSSNSDSDSVSTGSSSSASSSSDSSSDMDDDDDDDSSDSSDENEEEEDANDDDNKIDKEGDEKETKVKSKKKAKEKGVGRKKKKDKDNDSGDKLKDSSKKLKLSQKRQRKKEKEKKRRNIRSILRDDQLEAETLAAQNEEMERQHRLQELKKQMQQKVVIKPEEKDSQLKSLLEGDCPADTFYLAPEQIAPEDTAKPYAKDDVILLDSGDDNKKKVLTDIIELSDDDDVVMIKSDEEPEEEEEEEEEDMDNVGTHINDLMNQKDEQERVLVNIGHPEGDPDVFLATQIAEVIKPHQIGGVRFLYDNVIESQSRFKTSSGFGCILAHSMGLGKTIQLIGFIDIFLRFTEARSAICIVPINTLQNWIAEFNMWLPEKPPEDAEEDVDENMMFRSFKLFVINDNHKTTLGRAKILDEWSRVGGVLLMGYEMYRLLVTKKCTFGPPSRRRKKNTEPIIIDIEEEDMNKKLHLGIQKALVNPGPDLIVCDEGHRIKNSLSGVALSLKNIRTKRRIVLTGYPLQNNLLEYWCMVDFVRPNYLGTKAEFCNMFERPIMNGQCVDSTREDVTLMRYRAHVLHSLLQGFIQRRGHSVLHHSLPPKQEHVFNIRMSDIQRKLYKKFMECISDCEMGMWASYNPLKAFSTCCKIWNHPDVMWRVIQQQKSLAEDNDLDFEPDGKVNGQSAGGRRKNKSGAGRSSQSQQAFTKRSQSHTERNNSSSRNSNINCCNSNVNNCGGPNSNSNSCTSGATMNSCGNSGTGSGSNSCGSPGMNSCSSPNMNSCAGPCSNANLSTGMGSMNSGMNPCCNTGMNASSHMGTNNSMNTCGQISSSSGINKLSHMDMNSCGQMGANLDMNSCGQMGANLDMNSCGQMGANLDMNSCGQMGANLDMNSCGQMGANLDMNSCGQMGANLDMNSCSQMGANLDMNSCGQMGANLDMNSCGQMGANLDMNSCGQMGRNPNLNACGNMDMNTCGQMNTNIDLNACNQMDMNACGQMSCGMDMNPGSHMGNSSMAPSSHLGNSSMNPTGHMGSSSMNPGSHIGNSSINPNSHMNPAGHMGNSSMNASSHTMTLGGHMGSNTMTMGGHMSSNTINMNSHMNNNTMTVGGHMGNNSMNPGGHMSSNPMNMGGNSMNTGGHMGSSPMNLGNNPMTASNHMSGNSMNIGGPMGNNPMNTGGHITSSHMGGNSMNTGHMSSNPMNMSSHMGGNSMNTTGNSVNTTNQMNSNSMNTASQMNSNSMNTASQMNSNSMNTAGQMNNSSMNMAGQIHSNSTNVGGQVTSNSVNASGPMGSNSGMNSNAGGPMSSQMTNNMNAAANSVCASSGQTSCERGVGTTGTNNSSNSSNNNCCQNGGTGSSGSTANSCSNTNVNTCAQNTGTVSTGTNSCSQGVQANVQTDKRSDLLSLDWVAEVMKDYTPGLLENGGKIVLLFSLIEESLKIGDKLLLFSQSLTTLNVIEDFLCKTAIPRPDTKEKWCKNKNYFRLDGSTSAAEREKLINQFNAPDNNKIWLFLLSTRAGCLGINLIGANRVVIFDASWNPCHDCQAVCRVYRYGQNKRSYIYRLITDNTLEKKIYDRQINKQGMSDRVVDELNPENQFTRQQVDSLLHYVDQDLPELDLKDLDLCTDPVMKNVLSAHGKWLTKQPFTHESLLLDQKSLRLTKKEKQLAKQGYVMEKKMNLSYSRQSYSVYYSKPGQATYYTTNAQWPNNFQPGERPVASVKPIISTPVPMPLPHVNFPLNQMLRSTMPGQQVKVVRPGVSVHQIVTTTDIMLPGSNNNSSYPDVIAAGQQIHVIKTPRGVYIRTNKGKIFAVRSKPVNSAGTQVSTSTSTSTASISDLLLPSPSTTSIAVGTNTGSSSSSTTTAANSVTTSSSKTTTPSSNASGTTQLTLLDNRSSSQVTSNSNNNASTNTTTNNSATTTITTTNSSSSSNTTSGSTNSAYPEYLNYLRSLKQSFQPNYQLLGNNIGGTGSSGNNFGNQLLSPHLMQSTPSKSSFLSSSSSSSSSRQLGSQPLPAQPPHPPKPISMQKDNDIYIISDDEGKVDSEPDIVGSNSSSGVGIAGSNSNTLSSLLPQTSSPLELSDLIGDTPLQSSGTPGSSGSTAQSSFSCSSLPSISPSPLNQVLQPSSSAAGNPASCNPNTEPPNLSTFSSVPQAPPLHHHQQQLQQPLPASITNSGLSTPPSNLSLSPSNFGSPLSSLPPPSQQQQQQQSLYNMPSFNYGYMLPQTMMMSNNGTSSTGNSGYHPLANSSSVMNQPLLKNTHPGKTPSGTNLQVSSNNTDPSLSSLQQVHSSSSLLSPPDHHPHPLQQLSEPNDLAEQQPNIGLGGPSPILTLPSLSLSPDLTHPASSQI